MNLRKLLTAPIIIALAIICMIASSYISYSRISGLNSLSGWVNHTNIVKLKLQETYSDLSDADSELTKFLLTRDSAYLEHMFTLEGKIKDAIIDLKTLTVDNPVQSKRVASLDSLMNSRFVLMDIGLKNSGEEYDGVVARISVLNTSTKKLMSVLMNEESKLLIAREKSADDYKAWTPVMILTIEVAIIGFLFVAYFYVATELTTKIKLQKELQKQMDFIRTVLDNSVDMIVVFDKDLNVVVANKKAMETLGISESAIGRNIFDLFPQSRNSDSHRALIRALKGEPAHFPKLKSTVTDKIFQSFFVPMGDSTGTNAVISIHHDITELVAAAQELEKRNEELRVSNQQLEQFAYVASHDLQEPLRKIQTFSNLAVRYHGDAEKLGNYLSKVEKSAARMSKLIRDILQYSRISNVLSAIEVVDLNEVLGQVIQDLELTIEEKNAIVKVNKLPSIRGSRQQMLQLFTNLLSNSLKFSEKVPEITVEVRTEGSYHAIAVKDNGIGFDQKYEAQIFDVFKRLHDPAAYSGTGIGLSICKRVVDNHKGYIKVESAAGKGTTFTIFLPRDEHQELNGKNGSELLARVVGIETQLTN